MAYPVRFAVVTATSVAATLFNLAIPRLLGTSVDQVHALLRSHTVDTAVVERALGMTALLIVGAATMRGVLQMTSGFQGEYIGQAVGRDLRLVFFEQLQRLGFDYHDRVHSGDLITRGMLDLEGVRGFIENGLQRFIALILLLGIGSALLLLQDPLMALLTLSFTPFVGVRAARMGLALRRAWTKLQERMSVLTRVMEENLQGVRLVRAFASKTFELEKFDHASDEALALSNDRILIRSRSMAFINSSYYLAMALVLAVGGHRVVNGQLTIGQLTEFLTFMTILQQPMRQIGMIMNSSARAISSGKRLFEVLDLAPAIQDKADAHPLILTRGELRFENVSFSYQQDAHTPPILDDISFAVQPGATLGIVGPSGAGKSTLAQLIARFYDVSDGRITIDGQDIRDVTLESLRGAVGVIQQDVFLFDDSARDNIAYAAPEIEDTSLIDAAATAQIHDYVHALPDGYGSLIGERGVTLSGGQRQRLSISRGLVPKPAIMVFDDATSAVDAATEHKLREALNDARRDATNIIISHRVGSLMHADEIIVLADGRIIERGNHGALLARDGYYAMLYRAQSNPLGARELAFQNGAI
jgi:ATP-binding cassette subfamily B protein